MTSRLSLPWLLSLCLLAALSAPATAGATPSSGCDNRVNDTPRKLVPCITTDDLWNHMKAFQAIADANPGPDGHPSRNSGEPGYKASVDYVARLMKQAGYDVTIQPYTFTYTAFVGTPTWSEVSPTARSFTLVGDWNPGTSNGDAAGAQVKPAGGIVLPPTPTPSSTSGCTAADFDSSFAGKIALIQRGGCNYGVKVLNAEAAGAVGVVVFNEGNPGRTAVIAGSLLDANNDPFVPSVPVAFTSFATGQSLYNEYQAGTPPVMNLSIHVVVDPNRADYNVIAESKGGDPNHVVVVDAHLDAIYGAGMLDNASGSATILDIAQKMRKVKPLNKLRFIWFGGEELGLLGSHYYVDHLSSSELSRIRYDLDADVTATPNYTIGVLDPAAPDFFGRTVSTTFPPQVYEPSTVARDQAVAFFDSIGKNHMFFSPVGTDAFSFNEAGVPASGLLTGQDCCKTQEEVDLFGGYLGNYEGNVPSFDGGCVDNPFRWCDNLSNNDPGVLTFMSRAFADMTVRMAYDKDVRVGGGQHDPQTERNTGRGRPADGPVALSVAPGVRPGATAARPARHLTPASRRRVPRGGTELALAEASAAGWAGGEAPFPPTRMNGCAARAGVGASEFELAADRGDAPPRSVPFAPDPGPPAQLRAAVAARVGQPQPDPAESSTRRAGDPVDDHTHVRSASRQLESDRDGIPVGAFRREPTPTRRRMCPWRHA